MDERRFYLREEYSPRDLTWEDLGKVVTESQLKERLVKAFNLRRDYVYSPTFNWERALDIIFYGRDRK